MSADGDTKNLLKKERRHSARRGGISLSDDERLVRELVEGSEEHPDGYVLNCYKTGRVHSARCKSYRSAGPRMTFTRAKACSSSERQLFEYAEQRDIDATRCELC